MFRKIFLTATIVLLVTNGFAQFSKFIVELKNKTGSAYSINRPYEFLTQRALDKRQLHNIAIDSTDLPIVQRYLDSIRLAGAVSIINTSKWLNQVCVQSVDAAAMNKIANFPFVKTISGIAARNNDGPFMPVGEKFSQENNIEEITTEIPQTELTNIYNYGQSYGQVHLHQGEFLHNYGFSGQGMQMAILDAGFLNYQTLPTFDSIRNSGQILGTWDFVANNASVNEDHSHGTHCLSTIAANMPGSFVGTSPKTSFYLYRTENASTEFPIEEQNLAAGLERADSLGVDISSISLGYTTFDNSSLNHNYSQMNGNTTIAARAADFAAKKGMLLVVANGNDGNSAWHYLSTPADADSVMAVGAVGTDGVVGNFSSYGPSSDGQIKPSVAAVGVNAVVANAATGQPAYSNGTSFATPNIAGLSSCLWQAFPESNNMGIISALEESATKYASPDDRVGYGIPDMKKAFVILLKRFYSQDIKQAGCSTLVKWKVKAGNNMSFAVERRLITDAQFTNIFNSNVSGNFSVREFTFWDDLSAIPTPTTFVYRIRATMDTDTSFTFPAVTINHQNPCATYTFTGNGNWNVAGNWNGNLMPPASLPAGGTIIIDPIVAGECILNTTQVLQAGAYIEVKSGKKLTVQGNLIIQ